ncbi:MAG: hypothetical protein EXX96DRAFT_124501 [Benjaminiella poitrasii]|nr:MAG: hypothetical protein EXX96DRAFT_124501 [Benjaminiella poitrasii]
MEDFIRTYCSCDSENKSTHIIEHHVVDILKETLQPAFRKEAVNHPVLSNKSKSKYASDDFIDKQEWKNGIYVDLLTWIMDSLSVSYVFFLLCIISCLLTCIDKAEHLEKDFHLILPPVLIVLDDYDIDYKIKGVKMVHVMINKLDPSFFSRNGLDNVFFEVCKR